MQKIVLSIKLGIVVVIEVVVIGNERIKGWEINNM